MRLVSVILLAWLWLGQTPFTIQESASFKVEGPQYLIIHGAANVELVRISMKDGTITYGPNYKPDEAAKIFWEAMARPCRPEADAEKLK